MRLSRCSATKLHRGSFTRADSWRKWSPSPMPVEKDYLFCKALEAVLPGQESERLDLGSAVKLRLRTRLPGAPDPVDQHGGTLG